ncbi:MAG: ester cyclase [Candidatus Kariarchaeaceae archaeon]
MSRKKEYAKKFIINVLTNGNLEVLDEILHPEYYDDKHLTKDDLTWNRVTSWMQIGTDRLNWEGYNDEGTPRESGIEAAKRRIGQDDHLKWSKVKIFKIAEDNETVIITYTFSLVHNKKFFGINPTNRELFCNGAHILTFVDGKIVKTSFINDTYQMLNAMGQIILREGDEEKIEQYLGVLRQRNLIP